MAAIAPEEAVISVLAATPEHKVRGKKRIQKITFLCTFCDALISAHFSIRHFGVFSSEIAGALDILTTFGDLDTHDEQIGPNGYFTTVYSLAEGLNHKPDSRVAKVAKALASYSTPSLEVASTVAYFIRQGHTETAAIRETKELKPALSTPAQFVTTKRLLKELAELRAAGNGKRSEGT